MSTTWGYGLGILTAYISTHLILHQAYADWGDLVTIFIIWVVFDVVIGIFRLFLS